jgi:hypothetical protein
VSGVPDDALDVMQLPPSPITAAAGLHGVHQSRLGLPGAVHADAQIEVVGTVAGLAAVPSGSRRASSELEREAACHQMRS